MVKLRTFPAALLTLSILLPEPAPAPAASPRDLATAGMAAEQAQANQDSPRFHLGRRKKIVEFVMPPVTLAEETPPEAPPLVTLRSDPALRAKYPPNPNARTVSEAFREEFGKLDEFNFTLQGVDEDLLIRQARTNALMSLAGRVYYCDRILLSQDLLPKYFEQNGDRFIRTQKVENRKIVGGKPQFDLKLAVDCDLLMTDLEEKRFIFRPQLRPIFFVFLDQTVNGEKDDAQMGRKALEAVVRDRNQRYAEEGLPSMANVDQHVAANKDIFLEARRAAQRNTVEVALSGSIVARPTDHAAAISEEDWKNNTLEVAVQTDVLPNPVAARLPLDLLLKKLDEELADRQAKGLREWWDVKGIQVDVPLETMVLTNADSAKLEEAGIQPTTIVPANRLGLKRVYYKQAFHTSVRLNLMLVRVDNGEILAETTAESVESGETREASVQKAIEQASNAAANRLIDRFMEVWPQEMGNKADYKVMVTEISPDQLESMISLIEGSVNGAKVYLRSIVGSTAVMTVKYPRSLQQLMQVIDSLNYPKMRLVTKEDKALEYEKI